MIVEIPFKLSIFNFPINIHWILETLSFIIAFRYYSLLKKNYIDNISSLNRLSIIVGAIFGAFVGSRIIGFLENPVINFERNWLVELMNVKTIMGGLFGGLIGVEIAKKKIGVKDSSGDLFTLPIIIGIIIGRIGCFLSGTNEFTYGIESTFFLAMNLGDGKLRHPIALYEIVFLAIMFPIFRYHFYKRHLKNGLLFQYFMLIYFGFRFLIEFIKPNIFFILNLSTIQWLSIVCYLYYFNTIKEIFKNARKRL
jgi:prolipoprotein diacylglyceryltransferase